MARATNCHLGIRLRAEPALLRLQVRLIALGRSGLLERGQRLPPPFLLVEADGKEPQGQRGFDDEDTDSTCKGYTQSIGNRTIWRNQQTDRSIARDRTIVESVPCRKSVAAGCTALRKPSRAARSHCSITGWFVFSRLRSWSSTARLPSPCARGLSRDFVSSTPCWPARSSPTTISHTPPGRTCAAGLGRLAEARDSYDKALALVRCEPERRFLAGRLRELQ
jgi:hypothetical protein